MSDDASSAAPAARIAWIQHEIRNPLNVVMGTLRLLEMSTLTPAQKKQVDMCRAAAERIASFLTSLDAAGSSLPLAETAAELRGLGEVDFLTKPFERSALLRMVQLAGGTKRSLRLLAADDVPEVGWLLESLLASSGCALEVVRDGAAAIERAKATPFDVILLDLDMPGVNGLDAARGIRNNEKRNGLAKTPIIVVSGHDLASKAPEDVEEEGDNEVRTDPEVAPLVPEFLANRQADVPRVREAVIAEDWDTARSLGHKMKGTGRGFGFARISEIGRSLERAATEKDAKACASAADALEAYLERVLAR
ncbi:MAG: response regulator [Acidobacteriota bacterium]|nr:response regulator [Acidobacteriota bacterium]